MSQLPNLGQGRSRLRKGLAGLGLAALITRARQAVCALPAALANRLSNGRLRARQLVVERTSELLAVRNRLNLALESAGLGWWDYDVQTGRVEVCERVASIVGYSLTELPPVTVSTWLELCHSADVEETRALFRRHFAGELESFVHEYRIRHRSGGWVWVNHSARVTERDSAGRPQRMTGTLADITKRKRADSQLLEERNLFMAGPVVVFKWAPVEGRPVLYVSPNLLESFGHCPEALTQTGRSYSDFIHPDDAGVVARELAGLLADGRCAAHRQQYRLRHASGSWRTVDDYITFVRDGDGKATAIYGYIHDVTPQREAQTAVSRAAELRRALLDNSAVGIFLASPGRTILQASKRACDLLGYAPEEILGQSFAMIHASAENFEAFREQYRLLAISGSASVEYPFRRKDGTEVWCQASGTPLDPLDSAKGVIWTLQDITERRRAEEALRASEKRLAHALDATGEGVWEWDIGAGVVRHNAQWCRILGIEDGSLEHPMSQLSAMLHEQDRGAVQDRLQACLRGEGRYQSEHRVRRCGGRVIWIEDRGRVVEWDEDDQALRMIGSLVDVTDRKRADAELRQVNVELQQAIAQANEMAAEARRANVAKGEFLANMSHEIRTPLNAVLGMTSLLLGTGLDDDQRHYASTVHSSGEALLSLINDILDFSKMEAKKLELESLEFDPRGLLDDLAAMMAVRACEKGIEFVCFAAPGVPSRLWGDPQRIRQVLTNLAGNAVKFTNRGEVVVRADLADEAGRIPTVLFSVRDSGIGIAPDKQEMIFDSFTQVDASTSRQYGGTGLGLAISKHLVELMGGRIGVTSESGKGSRFWFTVPFNRMPAAAADGPGLASQAVLRGKRILVADDSPASREALIIQLRAWGASAEEAPDGPSALRHLRDMQAAGNPCDLALLDSEMPGLGGKDLGWAIRRDELLRHTRLVLMSLGTRSGDAAHTRELGFDAWLSKPVGHAALLACLSESVEGATGQRATSLDPDAWPTTFHDVRILLAEDNVTNQEVALGMLKKFGLRADAVANGAEAVMALQWSHYDLVFMDVQMPGMNGYEATQAIRDPRSAVQNHQVPIVAMTANAMNGDREECLQAGMDDYVSKPIDPRVLARVLAQWLPAASPGHKETVAPSLVSDASRASPPAGDDGVFDRDGFWARMMGDRALAEAVVEGFLSDAPARLAALERSSEADDVPGLIREAHSIKGAAANLGAETLRQAASRVEQAGRSGDLEAARQLLPALHDCLAAVSARVRDLAR